MNNYFIYHRFILFTVVLFGKFIEWISFVYLYCWSMIWFFNTIDIGEIASA